MTIHGATDKRRQISTAMGGLWWLVVLTLALNGCCNSSTMRLSTNPLKAKRQVLKEVPIGTPLKIAEEEMRSLGFHCEIRKAGEFGDQITARGERGEYRRYQNIDYLACTKERVITGIYHRAWVIALVYDKEQVVTNVLIQVWNRYYL